MAAKPSFELRLRVLNAVHDAPGNNMRERIKSVANKTFADVLSGHTYRFTWRTISTWLYRHRKNGIATLENKTRSDKDASRKVQVNQLAEAIHETLPSLAHNKVGVIPKSVDSLCVSAAYVTNTWTRDAKRALPRFFTL